MNGSTPMSPQDFEQEKIDAQGRLAGAGRKFQAIRDTKSKLNDDVYTMNTDPSKLGMTDAVKQQMQDEAQRADAMARQNQIQQLGSQALGAGPVAQNQLQEAAETIGAQGGEAAAKVSADIGKLNTRLVEQRKAQIGQEMQAAANNARQRNQFWTQFGLDSVATLGKLIPLI